MIDRNQLAEELKLRKQIRKAIKIVNERRKKVEKATIQEEQQLRNVIRKLIKEAEVSTAVPQRSTGINVLEELLKKIVPVLETDYKSLTSNESQRQSFRSHIVNAVVKTLTPAIANNAADGTTGDVSEYEEEVDIEVTDDEGDDKFIDIRTDAEKAADEENDQPDEKEEFGSGVEGDETGRNMAYQSFKKIESAIIDSYELLSDPDDQELF